MKIGMLWFDNSNSPLSKKMAGAISYYEKKFGQNPTVAFVHPMTAIDECTIKIKTSRSILPNHIWLGVDE